MALPNEATPLDSFFDDFLFTAAYLSGTKAFVVQGKRLMVVRKGVQAAVTARNDARDTWMLANVAQSVAWEGLREPLESFERQTAAHFDKDRKGYQQVFHSTIPMLLRTPPGGREDALKEVLSFAGKSGHAGKLGSTGKELTVAWGHYQVEAKAEKQAADQLAKAVEGVAEAKRTALVAMRETEGQLRSHFAADPGLVKRFFRSKATRSAQKKGTKVTDAPVPKPALLTAAKDSGAAAAVSPP